MNDEQIYDAISALRERYHLPLVLEMTHNYCRAQISKSIHSTDLVTEGADFAYDTIARATLTDADRPKDEVDAMAEVLRYVTGHTYVSSYSSYQKEDEERARGENRARRKVLDYLNDAWFRHLGKDDD